MAVLVMVSVRDRAADIFARPFFSPSLNLAVRIFSDEINRAAQDNPMWLHPDDFDLYELGSFDESDGSFVYYTPKQVAIGKDCRQAYENRLAAQAAKED